MFATDEVVDEAALRRVSSAYARGADGSVDLSDVRARAAAALRLREQGTSDKGDGSRSSSDNTHERRADAMLQQLLRRAPTLADVAKAYSATSAAQQQQQQLSRGDASSTSSAAALVARKRLRTLVSERLSTSQLSRRGGDDEGGDGAATRVPTMHFVDGFVATDFLGRGFVQPPPLLVQQADALRERPCAVPRTLRGAFRDAANTAANNSGSSNSGSSAGVQQLRWAPPRYAHLLFSADLQGEVRLWDVDGSTRSNKSSSSSKDSSSSSSSSSSQTSARTCIATYRAHTRPVKSLEVTSDAAVMSSGSTDGTVVLWDVEAGQCRHVVTNPEQLPIVQHLHHPSNEHALLLAAADKKVVLYDLRVSVTRYQREYTGHMGTIFNLTLLSGGGKMLTTAEDRTLRTWDYRIPVQIKQFADAGMHAITHVVPHPHEPYLAAQSLDNKVLVFEDDGGGRLKLLRHRSFAGHTISGTRCQLAFSHDGRYISSGDIAGTLFVWQWASGQLARSFKAHAQMLVSHLWHPLEPSRVVTSAWDGTIRTWA